MTSRSGVIALLTDFGLQDPYVGVMKGVILGIHPEARIVDVTHGVSPQDVRGAAFHLAASVRYFPAGTVFVAVVDPGVGSARPILAVHAEHRIFLAPDNGLLGFLLDERPRAFRVENESLFLSPVSSTFHGRDIFAPVAARLARDLDVSEVGPAAATFERLELPVPRAGRNGALIGEVVSVDRFGNLVTNIPAASVPPDPEVRVGRRAVRGVSRTYADGKKGALIALIGSSGTLEICAVEGDARKATGAKAGARVEIRARGR